jgi:uncharacterized protein (TIGR03067 family)
MRATVLALGACLAATAACGDEPLAGQWIAISAEENGAAADDTIGRRLTFEDGGFRIVGTDGEVVAEGTFSADPAADPATIDLTPTGGSGAGGDWAGIWKRDGTMLTIVDNAPDPRRPRPSAFSAPVGSGYAMIVLTPWK